MTLFQGLIFVYSGFFWWDTRWVSQEPMMRLIDSSHSSSTSMILLSDSVHSVSPLIPYFTTLILGVDDALCPRWCASLIKEDPGFLLFLPREGSFYASRSKSFFWKKKGKGTQHSVAFAIALPTTRQLLFPSTSMLGCYSVLGGREKNSLQCYLRSLPEQICEDQAFWLYPQSWARSCLPGSTFLTSSVPN